MSIATSAASTGTLVTPSAAAEPCRNCDTPRVGTFCHACSQPFQPGELTLRRLTVDFAVRHLSLEGGLVRTFTELCTRPGAMVRDYLGGRRQRYTHPVGYLALSAAASALSTGMWTEETSRALTRDFSAMAPPGDEAASRAFVDALMWVDGHPLPTAVVLCLILVPLLRVLFHGQIRTAEAAVFAFYVLGHTLLLEAILKPFVFALSADPVGDLGTWTMLLMVLLCGASAGGFFGVRVSTFVRMGVALAVSVGVLLGLVLAFAVAVVLVAGT